MAADTITLSGLLKTFYAGAIREAVNNTSNIDVLTTRDTESVVGDRVEICIHTGRNSGAGYGTETGTAPIPGSQRYEKIPTQTKKVWASWRITAKLLALAADDRGAFDNAMATEMKYLTKDLIDVKNKNAARNTGDGSFGTAVSAASSLTITLTDPRDAIYFEEGMIIDLWDSGVPGFLANGKARKISSVSLSAGTITLDTNATEYAGAGSGPVDTSLAAGPVLLALTGSISDGSSSFSPFALGESITAQGLDSIINTTPLFGIDPANVPKFAAIDANGTFSTGTNFIEQNVEMVIDKLTIEGAGEVPDLVLTSKTQIRQYQAQLRVERRQPSTLKLISGRSALYMVYEGKNIALIGDRYIKNGYSYFWRKEDLVQYEATPISWWAPNGGVLLQVPRTTQQEGILYQLYELAPRVRNNMIRKTDWSTAG